MTHPVGLRGVVVAVCVLAVSVTASPGVASSGSTPDVSNASTETLSFEYTFGRLPDRPGRVEVSVTTAVPGNVTTVSVELPANAMVRSLDGYANTDDPGELVWHRSANGTDRPRISYTVGVNETDDGALEDVDVGAWALFNWREVDLQWAYDREVDTPEPTVVERQAGTVGPGVVGPAIAYLGPYETETRTVGGERIRLVVPAAAPVVAPAATADALAAASDDLRVGGQSEVVTVYVAPDPIEATGRTARAGNGRAVDAFVAADEPLRTVDNAWLHEYVHTRQTYRSGPALVWFDDASAEYYAAVLAYRQGLATKWAVYEYIRTDRGHDATLSETDSGDDATYFKGMRVLAAADAGVRAATDGRQTAQAVFRALNAHEGVVTRETFVTALSDTAGDPREEFVRRYVDTDAAPAVPIYLDSQNVTTGKNATDVGTTDLDPGESSTRLGFGVILFFAGVFVVLASVRHWRG